MENKPKFTSGPWRICEGYEGFIPVDGWNEAAGESVEICRVSAEENQNPNATLISAAPSGGG
jgi:hypothetical protein